MFGASSPARKLKDEATLPPFLFSDGLLPISGLRDDALLDQPKLALVLRREILERLQQLLLPRQQGTMLDTRDKRVRMFYCRFRPWPRGAPWCPVGCGWLA